jgi:hypothetical protein
MMDPKQREAFERARETLAELRKLEARKAVLLRELAQALALRALWPELFENGNRATAWWIERKGFGGKRADRIALVVRSSTGEERKFPAAEVPEELHPAIARLDPRR